jgi:hypothetical protein
MGNNMLELDLPRRWAATVCSSETLPASGITAILASPARENLAD